MKDKHITISAGIWIVALMLCCFGFVEVFGPVMIVALGYALASDDSLTKSSAATFIVTATTAGSIWLGVYTHDLRNADFAYQAHRYAIGCRDADRWNSMGHLPGYPGPIPSQADAARCLDLDDSLDFHVGLEIAGW